MCHVTHMNESCHTCEQVMAYTNELVTSLLFMAQVKWVMSHIWMSHVTGKMFKSHAWMSLGTHVWTIGVCDRLDLCVSLSPRCVPWLIHMWTPSLLCFFVCDGLDLCVSCNRPDLCVACKYIIFIYLYIYLCLYIHVTISVCDCLDLCVPCKYIIFIYLYICICLCIHVYIHTRIHTYTHTYIMLRTLIKFIMGHSGAHVTSINGSCDTYEWVIYIHTRTHAHTQTHTRTHTHIHTHIHTRTHMHTHALMTCLCACVCACACVSWWSRGWKVQELPEALEHTHVVVA